MHRPSIMVNIICMLDATNICDEQLFQSMSVLVLSYIIPLNKEPEGISYMHRILYFVLLFFRI